MGCGRHEGGAFKGERRLKEVDVSHDTGVFREVEVGGVRVVFCEMVKEMEELRGREMESWCLTESKYSTVPLSYLQRLRFRNRQLKVSLQKSL